MRNLTIFLLLLLIVTSCSDSTKNQSTTNVLGTTLLTESELITSVAAEEETTISVPIEQHVFSISREKDEIKQAKLSDQNVRELESWWDSLPQPLQSEIKANKVDIEVVSEITTSDEQTINPDLNDSQIETTGETLEQIIGTNTDMKYTISTKLIDSAETTRLKVNEEHKTNIRLVKQVPVKLNTLGAEIYLRNEAVDNDNIRTLQYWWENLPADIKEKIKARELELNLTCHTVDAGVENSVVVSEEQASENATIMNDLMNRLVGVYRVGEKEFSMAKTSVEIKTEKATVKTANLPANQYITISLRKNKDYFPAL